MKTKPQLLLTNAMETTYTKKQSRIDKQLRQEYKCLTNPRSKLEWMSRAPLGAIYLCDLSSDAEDLNGQWFPMLGGFQIANGTEKYASESKELALAAALSARQVYEQRLVAYHAECRELE